MAKVDHDLDELEKQIEENQRKSDELGKEIDRQDKKVHPPKDAPDHDDEGGIF